MVTGVTIKCGTRAITNVSLSTIFMMVNRRVPPTIRSRILKAATDSQKIVKLHKYQEAKEILLNELSFELEKSFFYKLMNNPEVHPPKRALRIRTVSTQSNVELVVGLINETHGKLSLRRVTREIGISHTSVQRIIRKELFLKPYKPIKVQLLTEIDKIARLNFCDLMLDKIADDPDFHGRVIWTDETMVVVKV